MRRDRRLRPRFGFTLLLFGVSWVVVSQCSAEDPPNADVHSWIEQLNSSEFQLRDAATQKLIQARSTAVVPVIRAVTGASLEVTLRGVFILRELALCGEDLTEQAATEGLQKIAKDPLNRAAGRAREALIALDDLRQDRAFRELQKLGAVINPDHEEMGLTAGGVFAVEIGDKWQGRVEDLRHLRWLRDVEQLTLDGPQVTDAWFRYLEGMDQLYILKIRRAGISHEALAGLPAIKRLQYVKLLYVDIDDRAIKHLKRCTQVSKVLAYGTKLGDEGAAQLVEAGIDVDLRRGAFLGISVPRADEDKNWFINYVTPGSSADRAGILAGDRITQFDGREVVDFRSLMAMIAAHDVDDTAEVVVNRRGKLVTKAITFGEWE
jgi:hypothetical protein